MVWRKLNISRRLYDIASDFIPEEPEEYVIEAINQSIWRYYLNGLSWCSLDMLAADIQVSNGTLLWYAERIGLEIAPEIEMVGVNRQVEFSNYPIVDELRFKGKKPKTFKVTPILSDKYIEEKGLKAPSS